MSFWTFQQIPWNKLDLTKVDLGLLQLAKTASLVEYNSADYTQYLSNVFREDEWFHPHIQQWGQEERQHGLALKQWAELVDPKFDFEHALKRFQKAFRVPLQSQSSIRGSKARELIARCLVESGTTSYYSALADASEEPVLKAICANIAADEVRHYNLFYKTLQKYLPHERLSRWQRLKVAWERSAEVEDDELAFAYASANLMDEEPSRERLAFYNERFLQLAYNVYEKQHLQKGVRFALMAAGFHPQTWLLRPVTFTAFSFFKYRRKQLRKVPIQDFQKLRTQ